MSKLVTIGIPIYKRLEYLPNVLSIVAAQDYPNIELLISDNGLNGTAVPSIVERYYPKPYTFRQNPATVSASNHFTQLIDSAAGEYFIMLADDDEISPNYVSELVHVIERHPEASLALAVEEYIDETGKLISRSEPSVPEILSGPDFIRTTWNTREYGFRSLCTFLAKTQRLRACGGFPDIWAATGDEDLLVVKLCLDNFIAFSTHCAFRKRFYEASGGYAIPIQDLARGVREFLSRLDSDRLILEYAASHPVEWNELKRYLVTNAWKIYFFRWVNMYRKRMPPMQWFMAAFALPFIPGYYRVVARALRGAMLAPLRQFFPKAYDVYRGVRTKLGRATSE